MKQLKIIGIENSETAFGAMAELIYNPDEKGKPYGGIKGVISRYYLWRVISNLYRFHDDEQTRIEFEAEMEMNKLQSVQNYRKIKLEYTDQ